MLMNIKNLHRSFTFLALGISFLIASNIGGVFAQSTNPFDSPTIAKTDDKAETSASSNAKSEKSAVPAPPAPSTWTGFYVGGYLGGNFGRATVNTSTVFSPTGYFAASSVPAISISGTQKLTPNGFNGGGQVGYNYQAGHFVVGAEADIGSMTGTSSASTTTVYPCCGPTAFTITQSAKTTWVFTARPRAGFTAGNALFYATGGVAVTNVNYKTTFTDTFATAAESGNLKKTMTGWTGGGGMEYKVGSKWSFKGEYLFADFRRATITSTNLTAFAGPISFPTNVFTHSIYLKEHLVRFGINYHF